LGQAMMMFFGVQVSISPDFGYDSIFVHCPHPPEVIPLAFRFRGRCIPRSADGAYDWFCGRIIDVSEVPREKVVNVVHCRDGNMQGIGFRSGRKATVRYQLVCQFQNLLINDKFGDPIECLKPPSRCFRIPGRCFHDDQLGSEKFVIGTCLSPPLTGELLPRRGSDIGLVLR